MRMIICLDLPVQRNMVEYMYLLIRQLFTSLRERCWQNVERVEVLPYHTLGKFKWENLGIPYPLEEVKPPTQERVDNARRILGAI